MQIIQIKVIKIINEEEKKTVKDCLEILCHNTKFHNTENTLRKILKRHNIID